MQINPNTSRWVSIVGALFILAANFVGAHRANADQDDWIPYMSPANDEYVFTASLPPGWELENSQRGSVGFWNPDIPTSIAGRSATVRINITWAEIPSGFGSPFATSINANELPLETSMKIISGGLTSQQLDEIIPEEGCGDVVKLCKQFSRSPIEISDFKGLMIENAPHEVYDPQLMAMVAPEGPSRFVIFFAPNIDHIALRIDFSMMIPYCVDTFVLCPEIDGVREGYGFANSLQSAVYQSVLPDVMKFLSTAQFQHYLNLDDTTSVKLVYETGIRTTQRQDFWSKLLLELTYPANWQVKELVADPATADKMAGRLVATVTRPDDELSVGEPETLFVFLEGMGWDNERDFLATTEPLVRLFLDEFEIVSSEAVDIEGGFKYLASRRRGYSSGTVKTYVNTYVGKDRHGADLKIRTYMAGGQTTVANFIFVADAADFDRVLPAIEGMVETTRFNLQTPI